MDYPSLSPGIGAEALKALATFVPDEDLSISNRDFEAESLIVAEEMRRRVHLLQRASEDADARAAAYIAAKHDPIRFINDWVVTYDPRARDPLPKSVPFQLWPRQVELVRYIVSLYRTGKSGGVKKSRDIGASWIACAIAAWLFVFWPETAIGFGSNLQRNVDQLGDPKSLFWKVRFILHRLPHWMKPQGWKVGGDSDNALRIVNPQNGSTIMGEGGRQMGRSGRYSIYFLDEWAWVQYAESVWGGLVDTTETAIPISTSRGAGTHFWQLEQAKAIAFFHFKWTADPRKDLDWEASQRRKLGDTRFEIEHGMNDYAANPRQVIPAQWILAAVAENPADHSQRLSKQAGLDVGDGGGDESVLTRRYGSRIPPQDKWAQGLSQEVYQSMSDALGDHAFRVVVDKVGVGAGVPGALEPLVQNRGTTFERVANNYKVPEHWIFPDSELKPSDRFKDYITAAWWWLRLCLEQTFKASIGEDFDPDMVITIDEDDPILIAQLTSRRYVEMGDRIRIESKKEMKARGLQSPDRAESLVYACVPPLEVIRTKIIQPQDALSEMGSGRARSIRKGGW